MKISLVELGLIFILPMLFGQPVFANTSPKNTPTKPLTTTEDVKMAKLIWQIVPFKGIETHKSDVNDTTPELQIFFWYESPRDS